MALLRDVYGTLCRLAFLLAGVGQVLLSCCTWPCFWRAEKTKLSYVDTARNRFIIEKCSTLHSFKPTCWALYPYAQTVAQLARVPPKSKYQRELFMLPDGVEVALDWKDLPGMPADAPLIFCAHGLGGCSDSMYLQSFTHAMLKRGYRSVVYNRRGHAGQSLLPKAGFMQPVAEDTQDTPAAAAAGAEEYPSTPTAPSAAASLPCTPPTIKPSDPAADPSSPATAAAAAADPPTAPRRTQSQALSPTKIFPRHWDEDDMHAVVDHVVSRYPQARKYIVGFSCGANLITNYQGEMGSSSPFIASCSLSNGHDLVDGTKLVEDRWFVSGVVNMFLKDLLYEGRLQECQVIAKAYGIKVDWERVMRSRALRDLEAGIIVPAYQHSDVDDYYQQVSCHWRMKGIRLPHLSMGNTDDPLVHDGLIDYAVRASQLNPCIIAAWTRAGGHLGWLTGWRGRHWWIDVCTQFFEAAHEARKLPEEPLPQGGAAEPTMEPPRVQAGLSAVREAAGTATAGKPAPASSAAAPAEVALAVVHAHAEPTEAEDGEAGTSSAGRISGIGSGEIQVYIHGRPGAADSNAGGMLPLPSPPAKPCPGAAELPAAVQPTQLQP